MNRGFSVLRGVLVIGSTVASTWAAETAIPAPPNIIVILTDDQGYGDLGTTGNPVVQTPHLDAFARTSAQLASFYVSPVCSPTRASLLTGRYSYRTRVVDTWVGRSQLEPGEVTLAEFLRAAGYRTGIFGKWHLGDAYPMRALDQGFETSLVHDGGGLAQPSDPPENQLRYTDAWLWRQDELVQSKGYCTDVFFDAALEFISAGAAQHRPFFAYLSPNAPHGPFDDVPRELYEKYRRMDLSSVLRPGGDDADRVARVFAMVENIDANVGRLLARLHELGIADNTIVIFMSDNGPAGLRFNGPWRGKKADVYEGGIRTPFFFRWPAQILPGLVSSDPAAHIDVMPTLLAAAGVAPGRPLHLDGVNLLPLLRRQASAIPPRTLVLQWHRGDQPEAGHHFAAIRGEWKLVRPSPFAEPTASPEVPFELYRLDSDPAETTDLSAVHPQKVAELRRDYERWFADVSATRPDNYAPPRIVLNATAPERTRLTRQDWRLTEGDRWGTQGYWRLSAARDVRYGARVVFEKPVSGSLRWQAGAYVLTQEISSSRTVIDLPSVPLAEGAFDLTCVVDFQGAAVAAYQIELRRVTSTSSGEATAGVEQMTPKTHSTSP